MNRPSDTVLRVDISFLEGDEVVVESLEGEAAKRWYEMTEEVKIAAQAHNANLDWDSIVWKETKREKVEAKE